MLARAYPTVRLLRLRRNLGFSGNVNAGLRAARGEVLCLLNNDAQAEPDWLPVNPKVPVTKLNVCRRRRICWKSRPAFREWEPWVKENVSATRRFSSQMVLGATLPNPLNPLMLVAGTPVVNGWLVKPGISRSRAMLKFDPLITSRVEYRSRL